MKIKGYRKLAVWVLMIVVTGNIFCYQAEETERSNITFQQMIYENVPEAEVDILIGQGKELVKQFAREDYIDKTRTEALIQKEIDWEKAYYELYRKLLENSELAYLYYNLDNTDPYFHYAYNYCMDLIEKMKSEYFTLTEEDGEDLSAQMKQYYDVQAQRLSLQDQYHKLQRNVKIQIRGKAYSYIDILMSNYFTSKQKKEIIVGAWYNEYNRQAAEIFIKLVELDKESARLTGFPTVEAYMYDQFGREYSSEQIKTFSTYIKKYLPPIYKQIHKMNDKALETLKKCEYQEDEVLLEKLENGFINKYPELDESFQYLTKYGLYDFNGGRASKLPGGFTAYLSKYNVPFISLNYNYPYDTQMGLIHEFGHFNFRYQSNGKNVSLDLDETYSQSLELLALPYQSQIMGSDKLGEAVEISVMNNMLRAIIDGCIYNEFLQQVEENPKRTPLQLNALYKKITTEYGIEDEDPREWVEVTHNFEAPFYYTSYSVSAMAALELWAKSNQDYEDSMQTYLALVEAGKSYEFQEALAVVGLENPFDEEVVREVTKQLTQYFDLKGTYEVKEAA